MIVDRKASKLFTVSILSTASIFITDTQSSI